MSITGSDIQVSEPVLKRYVPTLDERLTALGIRLQLRRVPSGEYEAIDGRRYDGPESPYVACAATAHEAAEELIAIVEEHR